MLDHLHFEEPYEKEKNYVIVGHFCRLCEKKKEEKVCLKRSKAQ